METRRRLVAAAAGMFDHKGYANATLGDITRAAQVTKGALYFHFSSKSELAEAVQESGRALLVASVDRLHRASGSPLQTLIDATHWLADGLRREPTVRANFRLGRERDGDRPLFTDFHQVWRTLSWSLLEQARRTGELRTELTRVGPQTLVASTVCGIETFAGTAMSDAELRGRVVALWEFVLPGLVPAATRGGLRTTPPP